MNSALLKELEIIVPDPGLREFGGHHPAALFALSSAFQNYENVKLTTYCNLYCEVECINSIKSHKVNIVPFFRCDFYQDFYICSSYSSSQRYIRNLAQEYKEFFTVRANLEKQEELILFHTLNWQHASALTIALQSLQRQGVELPKIFIFVMYSPLQYINDDQLNLKRQLNFSLAFRWLSTSSHVELYAADAEIAHAFKSLLNVKLSIHPCFLLGASQSMRQRPPEDNQKQVIMYMGDAKANKGFLCLPTLINNLMDNDCLRQCKFVIQYTITNNDPALKTVNKDLNTLAKNHSNITLITNFMSQQKLMSVFRQSTAIIFNYDEAVYRNQSSGLLWMAGYFNLGVLLLSDTWLARESTRLGLNASSTTFDKAGTALESLMSARSAGSAYSSYAKTMYQDFSEWLINNRFNGEDNE